MYLVRVHLYSDNTVAFSEKWIVCMRTQYPKCLCTFNCFHAMGVHQSLLRYKLSVSFRFTEILVSGFT